MRPRPELVEFGCVMQCSVDNLVLNLELVGDPPVHGKQRTESVQASVKKQFCRHNRQAVY